MQRSQADFKDRARIRALYNFIYRRGIFFRFSVVLRIVTFILAFYVLYFNELVTTTDREVLKDKTVEEFYIWRKTDDNYNKDYILHMKSGLTYLVGFLPSKPDVFLQNDTLDVIKNIFGKPSFITKANSDHWIQVSKYRRFDNFLLFTAFISLLSLLVYDGYDYLFRVTVKIVLFIDIFSILFYAFV